MHSVQARVIFTRILLVLRCFSLFFRACRICASPGIALVAGAQKKAKKYDPQQFINELKQQVTDIVRDVMSDPTNRRITVMPPEEEKKKGKKK